MNLVLLLLFSLVLCSVGVFAKDPYPLNSTEIIIGYGYPCEEHLTEPTVDGWRLHLQRIPHGLKNAAGPRKGVVFFQHGLIDTSAGVNLNFPSESLSFLLADAGYDVWLGNNRGNGYSTINVNYRPTDKEYWDWSFDEMASIDFPAQTAYVLNYTKAEKLTYIGHSEGTIQAFAGLIENPSLASRFNLYIALAPVAYVEYVESPILDALAILHADEIFVLLGDKEFNLPNVIEILLPGFCTINPGLCSFVLDLLTGPTTFLNNTRQPYYLHYEPNPTSVKNMVHWSQGITEGTFAKFDYGKSGNIDHYNQPTPPQYEFQNFPTQAELPLALFTGGEDYLADPKDVERLLTLLPTPPYVHTEAEYAHLDPLIGITAFQRIYPLVIDLVGQAWNATNNGEILKL